MVSIIYCFILILQAFASDSFTLGEKLFRQNKPVEALPLLQAAAAEEKPNPAAFNYLGLTYFQLKQYEAAVDAFLLGTGMPFANEALLYFNAGNAAFVGGSYERASQLYAKCFEVNPLYSPAVLNRANAELKQQKLQEALDNYALYLNIEPEARQREQITRLIGVLQADLQAVQAREALRQAEETRRVAEAETQKKASEALAAAEAEKQRIAAEQRAAEEVKNAAAQAQRDLERQKLLEQISSSLKSSDSTNISAGSEGVLEYNYEPKLE